MEELREILGQGLAAEELESAICQLIGDGFVPKSEFEALGQKCVGLRDKMTQGEKQNAIEKAIMSAKGRNPKAIKALLDLDNITLQEDGTLMGLDLEAIKQSDGYLFDKEEVITSGTGFTTASATANANMNSEIARAIGIRN